MAEQTALDAIVRVEVSDEAIVKGRSGSNDRGRYEIPAKQVCYLWQGDRYPTRLEVAVPDVGPRKPGFYLLAGKCFQVGDYGRLKFSDRELSLVPIEDVAAALASKPPLRAAS